MLKFPQFPDWKPDLDATVLQNVPSRMDPRQTRIAIVGGGIGGLTLALALRQRGLSADIFEQAPQLTEVGAAVALSANSTRELQRPGVLDEIDAVSTEPSELIFRNWQDGRRIAAYPVRQDSRYRDHFGAPYFGIHRADLQRILSGALGGEGMHLGHRLVGIAEQGDAVALEFANGHIFHADLAIGADGIRSVVRRWVAGDEGVAYSGTSAFRGIVPADRLPSLPDPQAIQFWMSPGAHLLHYAIGGAGQDINYFAVVEGPQAWPRDDSSTAELQPGEASAAFKGWHPAVTEMIDATPHTSRWGLFVVPHLLRWHRDRVLLLGDATHAMVPHHGQGANTTIEDAITLAELLSGMEPGGLEAMMRRYQALRRARTRKIQRSSWMTNALLHLADDADLAQRDARVSAFPERFGWIHSFDALQSVARLPMVGS